MLRQAKAPPGRSSHKSNPRRHLHKDRTNIGTDPLIARLSSRFFSQVFSHGKRQRQPKQHQQPLRRPPSTDRKLRTGGLGTNFAAFGFGTAVPLGDGSASRQLLATVHHLYEQLCLERHETSRLRLNLSSKKQQLEATRALLERSMLIDTSATFGTAPLHNWRVHRTTNGVVQGVRCTIDVHICTPNDHQLSSQPAAAATATTTTAAAAASEHPEHHYGSRLRYEWSITAYDEASRAMHIGVFAEIKLYAYIHKLP